MFLGYFGMQCSSPPWRHGAEQTLLIAYIAPRCITASCGLSPHYMLGTYRVRDKSSYHGPSSCQPVNSCELLPMRKSWNNSDFGGNFTSSTCSYKNWQMNSLFFYLFIIYLWQAVDCFVCLAKELQRPGEILHKNPGFRHLLANW